MHDYGVVLDFRKGAIRINGEWVPSLKGGEEERTIKKIIKPRMKEKMAVGSKPPHARQRTTPEINSPQ